MCWDVGAESVLAHVAFSFASDTAPCKGGDLNLKPVTLVQTYVTV